MTTELAKTLPKTLPGAICAQWKKCGKPVCKCARGDLHGPYWYRFWREDGRLRKAYVRQTDVPAVRAACTEERQTKRMLGLMRALAREDWSRLASLLSEVAHA